ncbi:MAG: hypothetical protein ABI622_09595 [Chloroflexota bacterium]
MKRTARIRAILRRFGIGEERWIVDADEREAHRARVRHRLLGAKNAAGPAPRPTVEPPAESTE